MHNKYRGKSLAVVHDIGRGFPRLFIGQSLFMTVVIGDSYAE